VSDEYLKLTTYFAERLRSGDRFLADALLDLYEESAVATSVVLRGIASFGPHHVLRSDQSLSASEDSPIAIAAVDRADKIASLADRAAAATTRGLVTLERALLLAGSEAAPSSETVKLTVYIGRQERIGGRPAHRAVVDLLHRHEFHGAAAFLGVDGTARGERYRAAFFSRNVDVPMMIISMGAAARVSAVIAELGELAPRALLSVERARLCKRGGELIARPHRLPEADGQGRPLWQKLMVHTSEAATFGGAPIHRALVHRLLDSGVTRGATVVRGVWGFHDDQTPHGDKLFQLTRRVPVVTIVVDTPERVARSFDIVDELTAEHGLVTSEMVPAVVWLDGTDRDGDGRLARHDY